MSKWALKIAAKLVLGRIPGKNVLLRRFNIFKHGEMDDPAYALRVFKLHFERAYPEGDADGRVFLELGPGDSLLSGFIASAYGASKVYLVDVGRFASADLETYSAAEQVLKGEGIDLALSHDGVQVQDLLQTKNIQYMTEGLESLKNIPSESVDFIWSHSVLEHVRKKDFDETMQQLFRILKKDGVMSHSVDLKDHLDKSLNNLRFSDAFWENDFVADSGFYTNRLNYDVSKFIIENAGFEIKWVNLDYWDKLPTPKSVMNKMFKDVPEDILRIMRYNILAYKS